MAAPPLEPIIINTFTSFIQTFNDFLIASIHTILDSRAIYPPSTFIPTRKYNCEIPQNRHPKVCAWIKNACLAVQAQLLKGVVRHIIIIIYRQDTEDAEVIERWVFDVDRFPVAPEDQALTEFIALGGKGISLVDIEEQLRATIANITYRGKKLAPLPENCTYMVVVELKDSADPPTVLIAL